MGGGEGEGISPSSVNVKVDTSATSQPQVRYADGFHDIIADYDFIKLSPRVSGQDI